MATNPLRPAPTPELLLVGKTYEVEHIAFGRFVARAEEPHYGWCGFVIIHGNDDLDAQEFHEGSYIELTTGFFQADPLT